MVDPRLLALLLLAPAACAPPGSPAPAPSVTVLRLGSQLAGTAVEDPRVSQDHTLMDGALVTPGRLRSVQIDVPAGQPSLRFAITAPDPGGAPRRCLEAHSFTVDLQPAAGGPTQRIFAEPLARVDLHQQWHWRDVPLAAWEGQPVSLQLRLGAPGQADPACSTLAGAFGDLRVVAGEPLPLRAPDLLLVVVDTMRADHAGYVEGSPLATPNLVRWASEGAWFDDALATSSWTRESVHDLLTGSYTHVADVRPEAHGVTLTPRLPTIAEQLRAHGYRTVALMANPILEPPDGSQRGFDVFQAVDDAQQPAALDALLAGSDPRQPVFVYLHFMGPHLDYCYRDELSVPHFEAVGQPANPRDCLKVERDPATWTPALQALTHAYYRGEVEHADHVAGLAYEALRARAQGSSPWLVFTADHGEELWDHGGYEHGHSLFQELIRVPLLIRPPDSDGWVSGRRSDPVSLVDVAHTLAAVAELGPLERPVGRSLLPVLAGEPLPASRVRLAAGTIYGPARAATVIEGRKEAWDLGFETEVPTLEVYDLVADPSERSPVTIAGEPPSLSGSAWTVFRDLAVTGQLALRVELLPSDDGPFELEVDFPGRVQLAGAAPSEGAEIQLSRAGSRHTVSALVLEPTTLWLQLDGVQEQFDRVTLRAIGGDAVDWPRGAVVQGDAVGVPFPWSLYRPADLGEPVPEGVRARVRWSFPQGAARGGVHPDTTARLRALGYID